MKKLFFLVTLMGMFFMSCEKGSDTLTEVQTDEKDEIISKARRLSFDHDSLLTKMLLSEKNIERMKTKSLTTTSNQDFNELFDVIEDVTGVRPSVVNSSTGSDMIRKVKQNTVDYPVYNFDNNSISLAEYANSAEIEKYLLLVDNIIQDSTTGVSVKISRIDELQSRVKSDTTLIVKDFENFINTTEVMKGSLILWDNHFNKSEVMQHSNQMLKAKPIKEWSFLAKLGFVAAADAVGAVLGSFLGGFLIVNGVVIYVPAGPQGTYVGLATLSIIAGNMVGW